MVNTFILKYILYVVSIDLGFFVMGDITSVVEYSVVIISNFIL